MQERSQTTYWMMSCGKDDEDKQCKYNRILTNSHRNLSGFQTSALCPHMLSNLQQLECQMVQWCYDILLLWNQNTLHDSSIDCSNRFRERYNIILSSNLYEGSNERVNTKSFLHNYDWSNPLRIRIGTDFDYSIKQRHEVVIARSEIALAAFSCL